MSILPNKKMSSDSDIDIIRNLPKNAIEAILTCLPIRDAVRTSILSRGWRYEWSSIGQLVIDGQSFPPRQDLAQSEFDKKVVKAVDRILLLHCGPISKFQFSLGFESCANIDGWILFLSRNGINRLILNVLKGRIYKPPSCLFLCADLTHLQLCRCSFVPPTSFEGFKRLTSLALWIVRVDGNGLEILLSRCPLLKVLILVNITGCSRLNINARELVTLDIAGAFIMHLHFESTPLLTDACISLHSSDNSLVANRKDCKIVEFFVQKPMIQSLRLYCRTLQHLSDGDVPERLPVICPMKHLDMHINFEDMQELLAAFCIFRSSPVMQKLHIQAISNKDAARISAEGFWGGEDKFKVATFAHLQSVEVTGFTGTTSELKVIEIILANAPVLETLHLKLKKDVELGGDIFRKLLGLPRSSPNAQVIGPS